MENSVNYLSLMIATVLFVLTPGLGVALIISRTISDGFLRGIVVGMGLVLGDLTYASLVLLAFTGLADILQPYLFYLRILGAMYLVYLGVQQMRKGKIHLDDTAINRPIWQELGLYWMISVTNPKVMVFYIGFLPLFLPLGQLYLGQNILVILSLFTACFVGVILTVTFAIRLRKYLISDKTAPIINKVIGGLMCFVGGLLVI